MSIKIEPFGRAADGRDAALVTLKGKSGIAAAVTDYGAALVSLRVPDANGDVADVVLGFPDVSGYQNTATFMGATVGRHAGQINDGAFVLDGREYHTVVNDHDNTMHGGPGGFHSRFFAWRAGGGEVTFMYRSRDGEGGFPGNLDVEARYSFTDDDALMIEFRARADADTVLNMTNHAYFNLNGAGDILSHTLQIFAEEYTEVDAHGSPTGRILPVAGTPYDFTRAVAIGERIDADDGQLRACRGYDHNWVLGRVDDGRMRKACVLRNDSGDLTMELATNQPGVQMYSGNYLDGSETGKNGMVHAARSALCLEPQLFPNGLNHPHFPSPVLRRGEEYYHCSVYSFR